MEDSLIVTYDNCPPDVPVLIVARKNTIEILGSRLCDTTVLKTFRGDEAIRIYHYLTGTKEREETWKKVRKEYLGK